MTLTEMTTLRASAAARAEEHALALLDPALSPDDRAMILDGMNQAGHERDVMDEAIAVQRFRDGEPVAAVPHRAPWLGF